MLHIKYRIKILPIVILLVAVFSASLLLFPDCNYKLDGKTFKGTTEAGSLIALNFTVSGGEVSGYGCHLFKSGKENHVNFSGEIDCELGTFEIAETSIIDGSYFGTIRGKISESQMNIVGGWTNRFGEDFTQINLSFTEKTPEEVIFTESYKYIEKKAYQTGKTAQVKLWNVVKGFFD